MRLATIDVGTNTALLLVSEWRDGKLHVLHEAGGYVRLGEGLGASGRVSEAALERLKSVLRAHMDAARTWHVDHTIVTGTSASRDAENGADISSAVREETGTPYKIMTGDEEADMTFEGALVGWPGGRDYNGVVTVVDVGGGSTELVQGVWTGARAQRLSTVSLNLGTVRLTEKFFSVQPPSSQEVSACRTWTCSMLDAALAAYAKGKPLVGASGTAHVLLHLQQRHRGGSAVMTGEDIDYWERDLYGKTREQVQALAPNRMSGRADVFPAGVMVLHEAYRALGASRFHVSDYGVRHGVALRYFRELQDRQ